MLNRVIDVFLSVFADFKIESNEPLLPESRKKSTIDCVIYKPTKDGERMHFAFIVCTSGLKNISAKRRYAKGMIEQVVKESVAWVGLVIDGKDILSYNPATKKWTTNITINKVKADVETFLKTEKTFNEAVFKADLVKSIESLNLKRKGEKEIAELLKEAILENALENFGRTVSFGFESQFELISRLLRKRKVKPADELCRYTSMSSLHRNISNKCESMCGLAAMNDRTEGLYLDYCLGIDSTFSISRKPQNVVDKYNEVFIASFCDNKKSDDLTMWRLYGGKDGDGVCLIYKANKDLLRCSKDFLLAPVLYGNGNNAMVQLLRIVSKLPFICGYQFILSGKDVLSYFVKPADFKIEEEYRLLFINGKNSS